MKKARRSEPVRVSRGRPVSHERLAGVVIEQLDWREFLRRYDRPSTLFYLDPPYFGSEKDCGKNVFARTDLEETADQLAGLKGRFILSSNDHPDVRRTFHRFEMEEVKTTYTIARGEAVKVSELIVTGGLTGT